MDIFFLDSSNFGLLVKRCNYQAMKELVNFLVVSGYNDVVIPRDDFACKPADVKCANILYRNSAHQRQSYPWGKAVSELQRYTLG